MMCDVRESPEQEMLVVYHKFKKFKPEVTWYDETPSLPFKKGNQEFRIKYIYFPHGSLSVEFYTGVAYSRKSKDYQFLLNRAYNALYSQNETFRKCLEDAKNAIFTHSIGRNNEKETVLTEREFCSRLQHLKDVGLLPIQQEEW